MKIKIKRIDKTLPLPKYETAGAAAVDLYSRIDIEISPNSLALIPSNVIIEIPPGYMLAVVPRSGTPKKLGLSIPHGIGIIDPDFCGPEDEIKMQVYNFSKNTVSIAKGQRICQAVFVKIDKAQWDEVDQISDKTRGSFGSTG